MSTRRRPGEKLRLHTISVRLAPDELSVLDDQRQSMRRADYMRLALLNRLPVVVPQVNQAAWSAHGRLAANLNQLLRAVHAGKVHSCPPELLTELIELAGAYRHQLIGLKK